MLRAVAITSAAAAAVGPRATPRLRALQQGARENFALFRCSPPPHPVLFFRSLAVTDIGAGMSHQVRAALHVSSNVDVRIWRRLRPD